MGPQSSAYLEEFKRKLGKLPEDERKDVIQEIQGHIEERLQDGQLEVAILANLGDPKKLANAYKGDYYLQKSNSSVLEMVYLGSYYVGSSLLSMMIVPLLVALAYGFLLCAIVAIPAGIIDAVFDVSWISVGTEYTPRVFEIPMAILIALVCYVIYYVSKKALKAYLKLLSFTHRKVTSI